MGNKPLLVNRGGSWFSPPSLARVARRSLLAPGLRNVNLLGVRLVRVVNPIQQIAEVNDGE